MDVAEYGMFAHPAITCTSTTLTRGVNASLRESIDLQAQGITDDERARILGPSEKNFDAADFEAALRSLLRLLASESEDVTSVLEAQGNVQKAFGQLSREVVDSTGWSLAWWDQGGEVAELDSSESDYIVTLDVWERNAKRASRALNRLLLDQYDEADVPQSRSSYDCFLELLHHFVAEVDSAVGSALNIETTAVRKRRTRRS